MMNLTLDEGWTSKGRIELRDEKLIAPNEIPDRPGLYCLVFDEHTRYYGEASDLERRVGDYLLYYSGTGIESEFRINRALRKYQGAEVLIVVGEDLQSRSQRCTIESRLIRDAKTRGWKVLNGGSIPDRIAFHASEIIRLSAKLSAPEENQ